eukprot:6125644-Pyramimonas_sp.AAC.1
MTWGRSDPPGDAKFSRKPHLPRPRGSLRSQSAPLGSLHKLRDIRCQTDGAAHVHEGDVQHDFAPY